jgi:hypothetical protein
VKWSRLIYGGQWSLFAPSGLIARAVFVVLVFIILHAIGWRTYATVLSGTSPTGEPFTYTDSWRMVAYVLSYLFATVLAPILLIAALVLSLLTRRPHAAEPTKPIK